MHTPGSKHGLLLAYVITNMVVTVLIDYLRFLIT